MKYCRMCREQLEDDAKFCGRCGTKVLDDYSDMQTSDINKKNQPKKKSKKRILIIIGLAIIVLAAIIAISFVIRDKKKVKEYENYIAKAENYLEDMDYEAAEDSYLQAIKIDPKQREPYIKLAKIYVEQEEYDKAEKILEEADQADAEETEETKQEETEIEETIEERKNMIEFSWVVEPTIEADDIYYVSDSTAWDLPVNERFRQADNVRAIIQVDGQLGVIDMNGELLTEIAYKDISVYGESHCMTRTTPQYEEEFGGEWDLYWLTEDGEVHADIGNGAFELIWFYYYDAEIHCTYNEEHEYVVQKKEAPVNAIPVQEAARVYSIDNYKEWKSGLSEKYAISKKGGLITDFIYDECGSYSDGLHAVCQDGKWGYVNEKGEIIIPIEYDASWNHFVPFGADTEMDYCYSASDGYVVLCKDGEWELRDTSGNMAIPAGVFEAIRPVFDGKCWVKQDGKWGVIQLKSEDAEESEDVVEEIAEETEAESGTFTKEQLKEISSSLGVPEDMDVEITQGEPYYWDGGGCWLVHVRIDRDGEMIAMADIDVETLDMVKNIFTYSESY